MGRSVLLGSVCLSIVAQAAVAQEAPDEVVDLGDIDIVEQVQADDQPSPAYESFDPIDTGTSRIGADAIAAENQGDIDTTELIRKLPNVQLSVDADRVTQRNIQDIRPSDFVISGGKYYNNNIMIDGVQTNAVTDVTNDNPAHYIELAGATAQTVYIDPSLIGDIRVRDSNVSAEYGDFTGGVVEYELRQPSDTFGVSFTTSYQSDNMVDYMLASEQTPYGGDELPPEPGFDKTRYAISADLPVTDKFRLLASYAYSASSVAYEKLETYGGGVFDSSDIYRDYLLKGVYDFSDTLSLEGAVKVSPYESEYEYENKVGGKILTHSDGLTAYLKFLGNHAGWDWQSKVSYVLADSRRETDGQTSFSWTSSAPSIDWCAASSCSSGGSGDIDQTQEDYALDFKAERDMWGGLFRFGGEVRNIQVEKHRINDNYAYSRGVLADPLNCGDDTIACITDEVYLRQINAYLSFDAFAEINNESLWAEFERDFANVTLRGGLRYSHDDFLDNHDLSPRLTASWEFRPEWFFTLGANRYYGKDMVAYAIKSQYPDSYIYRRSATTDGSGLTTVGEWEIYRHTRYTDYSQADLNTPYSDELTAALTIPTSLNGHFRLKGILRDGRDEFAKSPSETVSFDAPTATSSTTRLYTITNDGRTDYESLSAEWSGGFDNHVFSFAITWEDKKVRGGTTSYLDEIDADELAGDLIYYNEQLITKDELYDIRNQEDFSRPIEGSFLWTSNWLENRLSTTLAVYYEGEYETIDDTYDNITIDGVRYDMYDVVKRETYIPVNLNATIELFENESGRGTLDLRAENIFDDESQATTTDSNPYKLGRALWIGFNYRY